jgi:NAD(P)-dependent dehydrogenase (short-subunit alcohol dehydrogenase family)
MTNQDVIVVLGAGGIGQAIARRQGPGKTVLLADFADGTLQSAADALTAAGHTVVTQHVDVSSLPSVAALADAADALGLVHQVVHTAGLSPAMAPVAAILAVDLVGTALVLEAFGRVIARGGAGIVVASMAGYRQPPLDDAEADALANAPADELLQLTFLARDAVPGPVRAYELSKRANHLRVQAAAVAWGARGARVNSLSPGVILTRSRGPSSTPIAAPRSRP